VKNGAIAILTTMVLGLASWAGSNVIDNKQKIARLEMNQETTHDMLKEVRADVKELLRKRK